MNTCLNKFHNYTTVTCVTDTGRFLNVYDSKFEHFEVHRFIFFLNVQIKLPIHNPLNNGVTQYIYYNNKKKMAIKGVGKFTANLIFSKLSLRMEAKIISGDLI